MKEILKGRERDGVDPVRLTRRQELEMRLEFESNILLAAYLMGYMPPGEFLRINNKYILPLRRKLTKGGR